LSRTDECPFAVVVDLDNGAIAVQRALFAEVVYPRENLFKLQRLRDALFQAFVAKEIPGSGSMPQRRRR
jgi:hypothetical protein